MANRWGKQRKQWQTLFSWAPKSLQMVTEAMKLKDDCFLVEMLWQPRQHFKKQRHYFSNKGLSSQNYVFFSSYVRMWELDHKESWVSNRCFWTVVLEKTLESPLYFKKIKPVNPKVIQSWIFTGRTDAEAELQSGGFGHLIWRTDSLVKTMMLGKNEGRRGR